MAAGVSTITRTAGSVLALAILIVLVGAAALTMGMPASALLGPAGVVFVLYALAAWLIGRASVRS
jgi:hypothetical protein